MPRTVIVADTLGHRFLIWPLTADQIFQMRSVAFDTAVDPRIAKLEEEMPYIQRKL